MLVKRKSGTKLAFRSLYRSAISKYEQFTQNIQQSCNPFDYANMKTPANYMASLTVTNRNWRDIDSGPRNRKDI